MTVRKRTYVDFAQHQPICATSAVGQIAVTTDTAVNFLFAGNTTFECRLEQANADIIPTKVLDADGASAAGANGWQIPNDNADNDGIEITQGILADATQRYVFTVGTDAFKVSLKMSIPDVSEYDICGVGFRKAAAYADAQNDFAADFGTGVKYTDFAFINVDNGDIKTTGAINQTGGGTGTATITDSTLNWADDEAKTLTVKVATTGVVTYEVDGTAVATATATTLDSGDKMIPFMVFTKDAANTDTPPILMTYFCGLQ